MKQSECKKERKGDRMNKRQTGTVSERRMER